MNVCRRCTLEVVPSLIVKCDQMCTIHCLFVLCVVKCEVKWLNQINGLTHVKRVLWLQMCDIKCMNKWRTLCFVQSRAQASWIITTSEEVHFNSNAVSRWAWIYYSEQLVVEWLSCEVKVARLPTSEKNNEHEIVKRALYMQNRYRHMCNVDLSNCSYKFFN